MSGDLMPLLKDALREFDLLADDAKCDHSTGICWCSFNEVRRRLQKAVGKSEAPKIMVRTMEQCAVNNANENGIGSHRYTGKDNLTLRCMYWEGRSPDEFRWVLVGPLGSEFIIDEDEAARRLEEWQS